MASRGPNVFAVSRAIWDDPDFPPEPFTEREAWTWLVSSAAWKATKTRGNTGGPVALARGEFSFSIRFLGEKWQWTKDRVHRFLERLEKRDTINDTSRDSQKVYSIKNYNRFQVVGVPKRDSNRDTDRDTTATAPRHDRDKEETGETGKQDKPSLRSGEATPPSEPKPSKPESKPSRWPAERIVPQEWIDVAHEKRAEHGLCEIDLRYEAERFKNYWASKSKDATKLDWRATWINWATDKTKTGNGQTDRKQTATDKHLAGIASLIGDIRAR